MSDTPPNSDDMKPHSRKRKPWFLRASFWTVIALHAIILLLFRLHSNNLSDRTLSKPYVTFISEDSLEQEAELEEYAMLFDSAPLFIPTRWNASQLVEIDFEDVSLERLEEFEPAIDLLSKLQPEGLLIGNNYPIEKPSDLLASRFWRFFEGFGQSAKTTKVFDRTMPVAEVFVTDDPGKPAISLEVNLEPAVSFSVPRPVRYTILRSNSGLVWSRPTLVETSGNEAFDQLVAQWLQRPDIVAQLPVGYLFIRVFFW